MGIEEVSLALLGSWVFYAAVILLAGLVWHRAIVAEEGWAVAIVGVFCVAIVAPIGLATCAVFIIAPLYWLGLVDLSGL